MALAELLRTLEEDAEARRAALLARANAEADRIRAEGGTALARQRAAALAARERELRATAARTIASARQQATRRLLEARSGALSRVRQRAESLLAERASAPAWLAALARDVELALDYMGELPAIVEAPSPLLKYLRGTMGGAARVTLEPTGDTRPAPVVRSADGSLTVDATPQGRLARAWPRLTIALAARLEARP
jgi:vacuolar-type H+-ATPase subunit E/Vma4